MLSEALFINNSLVYCHFLLLCSSHCESFESKDFCCCLLLTSVTISPMEEGMLLSAWVERYLHDCHLHEYLTNCERTHYSWVTKAKQRASFLWGWDLHLGTDKSFWNLVRQKTKRCLQQRGYVRTAMMEWWREASCFIVVLVKTQQVTEEPWFSQNKLDNNFDFKSQMCVLDYHWNDISWLQQQ